ncbi:hypothetical protein J5N97_010400 [Dioscorea zingiberensis]|uniref:Pentatricopeptide repeat-containing protein n=1 Tax=Dioscorea zingiberensis TaxID=325984 RepID=A0A9D5CYC0_9LILI|nr:hypothetical protein J5N97_010400 [Dioscorea zingiberensis]
MLRSKFSKREARLRAARAEYRAFKEDVEKRQERVLVLSGRPWERLKAVDLRGIWSYGKEDLGDGRLKREHLVELREMLEKRNAEEYEWLLDDDVEEARVLVRAFWEEGKVDEAIRAVRDMEQRGVVGIASVYYELACCLCNKGRWQEAVMEVEKLRRLPLAKPLEVTFTGMILSAVDGGYISDCISIFEYMNHLCTPNIGTINAMLKAYGCSDMFAKAKELFESTEEKSSDLKTKDNVSLKAR